MSIFGAGHEVVTSTTIPATAEEIIMAAAPYEPQNIVLPNE